MALHQVKRFNGAGKLVEIIPSEKLFVIGDGFNSEHVAPKKVPWVLITCEFCKAKAKVYIKGKRTCKRTVCEKKERDRKKAGKLKMKGGKLNSLDA